MGEFEKAKGSMKEALGDLTGNTALEREGEAQQAKAEAEKEARAARAEARAHEARADMEDLDQRIAQESE